MSNYHIKRILSDEIGGLADKYLVVTVLGPRQSGKTTLVREVFPNKPYVNLELPHIRDIAATDPVAFFNQYPEGAIIDEIQRVPKLLSYIQVIVDEKQKKGQFILTGSHQLQLHEKISQSLAGRTAIGKLLPFSIEELGGIDEQASLEERIFKGFFPRIYHDKLDPTKAYRNYYETYIERDVRQLINLKDLHVFDRFMRLLAGRVAQPINMTTLSNDVGVSVPTIREWLSILEASFVIFRLAPYYENFGKRITKAPKLYFLDPGFVCYLLGIENSSQVYRDPLRGHLTENLVVMELFKYRYNRGLDPSLYYFRDSKNHEVDVVYRSGNSLIPIEIKSAQTFSRSFLKQLHYFESIVENRMPRGYVVYAGKDSFEFGKIKLINFSETEKIFE